MSAQPTTADVTTAASEATILIRPRDPIVVRDARPFAAEPGARAVTLAWPLPRTVAGALRTFYGNQVMTPPVKWDEPKQPLAIQRDVKIAGPLLAAQFQPDGVWTIYLPAPRDMIAYRKEGALDALECMTLRPQEDGIEGAGCDLPRFGPDDRPATLHENVDLKPLTVTAEEKPDPHVPALWALPDLVKWLSTPARGKDELPLDVDQETGRETLRGLSLPAKEERTHVGIDPATKTNLMGSLFTTESLAFRDEPAADGKTPATALICRVRSAQAWPAGSAPVPLGGERRAAMLEVDPARAVWPGTPEAGEGMPPEAVLKERKRFCLYLATPAIFSGGWCPGWIADGTIPGLGRSGLGLKLVGAAVGRPVAVSGWRQAAPGHAKPHPRATVSAAPAGSIYFFEVVKGELTSAIWQALWLQPVSDWDGHRAEGFGLALPGLW